MICGFCYTNGTVSLPAQLCGKHNRPELSTLKQEGILSPFLST